MFIQRDGKEHGYHRFIAGSMAGIASALFSLPFDNIKTKLQKMKPDVYGVLPYNGSIDCLVKSVNRQGIRGLWIGLPVYIFRLGPHSMITLNLMDLLLGTYGSSKKIIKNSR